MNSSNQNEPYSDIIFKHKISLKDLTGKFKFSFLFIGFLLAIIWSLVFYSPSLFEKIFSFLFFKIWLFLFAVTVFDLFLTVLYTNAKVVLTKNSVFYKPPVSFRIYSLKYEDIEGYVKNRFYVTIFGRNTQKRFTVFMYGKSADDFLVNLKKHIKDLRDFSPESKFNFLEIFDKYFIIILLVVILTGFYILPLYCFIKASIGDYYYFEWQRSEYTEDIYRQCAENNYKKAVLNEKNCAYLRKYFRLERTN